MEAQRITGSATGTRAGLGVSSGRSGGMRRSSRHTIPMHKAVVALTLLIAVMSQLAWRAPAAAQALSLAGVQADTAAPATPPGPAGELLSGSSSGSAAATTQAAIDYIQFCVSQVGLGTVVLRGTAADAGTTVQVTLQNESPGVAPVSATPFGPWSETLVVVVQLDSAGNGQTNYYRQGLADGHTLSMASAPGWTFNSIDVTVGTIQSVRWVDDGRLTANTNEGGGQALFADKAAPSDTSDGREINFDVTATPGFTVLFRAFDVDDPSTDASPVDNNGQAGDDNRGTPHPGQLSAASGSADSTGHAIVTLRVTSHPGDNFRVVASCNSTYLNGLRVSGLNVVDSEGSTLPTSGAKITELLTVWRRVHIEVDTMAPVSGNFISATVAKVNKQRNTITLASPLQGGAGNPLGALPRGQYQGGLATINGIGSFRIADDSQLTVKLVDAIPAGQSPVGRAVTLVDDDDYNQSNGLQLTGDDGETLNAPAGFWDLAQDSTAVTSNLFAQAYIKPVYDGGGSLGNNNTQVPFALNVPDTALSTFIAQYKQSILGRSDEFWTAYILLGYQGETALDSDPGSEGVEGGATPSDVCSLSGVNSEASVAPGGDGSLLYLESIREAGGDWLVRVVPHELGHQFCLDDLSRKAVNSVMGPGPGPLRFSDAELNVLRWRVHSPGT